MDMQKISILLVAVLLSTATVVKGQNRDYAMAVHGGAGNVSQIENEPERAKLYYASLDSALMIGNNLLASGADGVEAVIAVLNYLENNPLFNAGKGATCTLEGTFELDAAIMEGKDLSAGAVAGVRIVKNPINAAYAVKQQTSHLLHRTRRILHSSCRCVSCMRPLQIPGRISGRGSPPYDPPGVKCRSRQRGIDCSR